jgi:outer membrane protein insertion porin family
MPSIGQLKKIAQGSPNEPETPIQFNTSPNSPIAPNTPSFPGSLPIQQQPATIPTDPQAPAVTPALPQTPSPAPTTPIVPGTPPTTPAAPTETPATPSEQQAPEEPRVLVSEVLVTGVSPELQQEVYRVIQTQAGRTTTRSQLQTDINAVFATGFFSNVKATPEDTPLGVRVTFEVVANPVLKTVQVQGSQVVPPEVVNRIFSPLYGKTTNFRDLQSGIQELTKYYQDRGFVLAQVTNAKQPQVNPDGTVILQVAEGEIERVQVRFINKEGNAQDAKGNPIRGRTRDYIITRELELKPGSVFNRNVLERDFQRLFGLGLFEDLRPSLDVGSDPSKVVLVVNVVEKNTGNISLGGGFSSASGLFGSVSYSQQNFGGNNQRLSADVQIGQRDQQYELSFTDPWIGGDPFRTSYTLSLFRRRTISLIFDSGDPEVFLANGDQPRINRTGGGVSFSRPLSKNVFERAEWVASLGLQYQRVTASDSQGIRRTVDALGDPLTFDPSGKDDLFTGQLLVRRDRRDDFFRPIRGSVLQFSTEQSVPIGSGSILFNRLRGSYSFYVPTRLLKLTPECRDRDPRRLDQQNTPQGRCAQAFAFNVQAGTVVGDLPPYEAFPLGGTNSVRGYDEGALGSGRSFVQATAEYRFPIFSIISGALFFDAASDLGTGSSVPGNPAGVRGKPGSGFGYGIGVRVQAGPLGPIRIDYGINDNGGSNIRFGFGERF